MRSHLAWFFRWLLPPVLTLSAVPLTFAADSQWIEIKSPHFSVVTDAGEKRGRETAMRFEQMRAVFGTLLTKANVNIPIPLQIVAFRNSKEFRQFVPLWNGKPVQLAGLFQGGEDRSFIMLDMSTENPWAVVFHEYAHQLMNGVLTARVDPWFEEGFAEYFSSIEVDSKEARVGKIPEDEYLVLQQQGMMKVGDLFRVQQNSSTYNESGSHRTVFYAESGMVMHYLYDNSLIPQLSKYFVLKLDQNVPVESAIQQSLGMSAADFDKVLRNYVSSGRFKYFPMPTPANIVSSEYADAAAQPGGQRRCDGGYPSPLARLPGESDRGIPGHTEDRSEQCRGVPWSGICLPAEAGSYPGGGILQTRGTGRFQGPARALLLGAADEP